MPRVNYIDANGKEFPQEVKVGFSVIQAEGKLAMGMREIRYL